MAGDNTLNFTDGSFDQEVLNSEVPVLVDFWAPWCGPCKAMTPTVDALATEYLGKIKIGKMNTDDNPSTPMRYQVRGIPTLILFKGGKPVDQTSRRDAEAGFEEDARPALGVISYCFARWTEVHHSSGFSWTKS